jgi:hypothetical protein
MADDENTNPTETVTTETQASAASQPAPAAETKVFTQDEVNRLMAKTREETRQRVLKENKQASSPAPAPAALAADEPGEKLSMKELKAQLDETNRRLRFADLVGSYQIDPALKSDFYDLCKVQNPSMDPDWFEAKAKLFMKQAPVANTNPVQPQTATPAEPAKAPPAAPAAPAKVAPTNGGVVDLFNLSPDQIQRMGPHGLRAEFEKITSIGQQLAGAPQRPKAPQR